MWYTLDIKLLMLDFSFLVDRYENHMVAVVGVDGDDTRVTYYRACALRSYLMVLIGTSIFVDKSATYVDVI